MQSYWIQAFPSPSTANVESGSLNVEVCGERPGGNTVCNKIDRRKIIISNGWGKLFSPINYLKITVIKAVCVLLLFSGARQELYCIGNVRVPIPPFCAPRGVSTRSHLSQTVRTLWYGCRVGADLEQCHCIVVTDLLSLKGIQREQEGETPNRSTQEEQKKKKRWTYISSGKLQSTVSLTWRLSTTNTRVCHWLSASRAPRKPQCSTTPPWPRKRKCRRFCESLSPRMIRPRSSLLFTLPSFFSIAPCCSLSILSSSFCTGPAFSTFFGSIKEKIYSFRWKVKGKNTQSHCVWQESIAQWCMCTVSLC